MCHPERRREAPKSKDEAPQRTAALRAVFFVLLCGLSTAGRCIAQNASPIVEAPLPQCIAQANDARYPEDVYKERKDVKALLGLYESVAVMQERCAAEFQSTDLLHREDMLHDAATSWYMYADLSYSVSAYDDARRGAQRSNKLFGQVLTILKSMNGAGHDPRYIEAEITANNDLLARIPQR